eukprot:g15511.t1
MDYPSARIRSPYKAEKATELSVDAGDLVYIVDETSSDKWIYGQKAEGASENSGTKKLKGWFPKDCLVVANSHFPLHGKKVVIQVAYTAAKETEVTVKVGDRLVLTDKHGDWLYGYMDEGFGNSHGWFPSFCVSEESGSSFTSTDSNNSNGHNEKRRISLAVSNLDPRDDGRMPLVSPIRKVRKDLEIGSANYPPRSVSLGGRIANNKPRSFFSDDDVYKRIIKGVERDAKSGPRMQKKDVINDDYNQVPECTRCGINPVTIAIEPCWHTILCEKCAKECKYCPKCKVKVINCQKIFL